MAELSCPFFGGLIWKGYYCKSSKDLEVMATDEIDKFLVCFCNCCHLPRTLGQVFILSASILTIVTGKLTKKLSVSC